MGVLTADDFPVINLNESKTSIFFFNHIAMEVLKGLDLIYFRRRGKREQIWGEKDS